MSGSGERTRTRLLVAAGILVGAALALFLNLLASAVPRDWLDRNWPRIAIGTGILIAITIALGLARRRGRRREGDGVVDKSARTDARGALGLVANFRTVKGNVLLNGPPDRVAASQHIEHDDQSITDLPPRNPAFTGRADLLARLRQLDNTADPVRVIALHGPNGVGKSQIAREYAHLRIDRYSLRWNIPATEPRQILAVLTRLAGRLGLDTEVEPTEIIAAVRDELSRRSGWLLIFDDADVPVDLLRYLPTNGDGLVLITSRSPSWSTVAHPIQVDCLPLEEAIEFLQSRTGDPNRAAAERLAQELGRLPLALAQAANYIETTPGMTLERCIDPFGEVHRRLLEDGRPDDYPASLAAIVKLNIQLLQTTHPEAIDLLHLCTFLAPDPESIALRLISAGADHLPRDLRAAVCDRDRLNQLTKALYARSLVGWGSRRHPSSPAGPEDRPRSA